MKKSISFATGFAAIAAFLCAGCNDSGINNGNPNWNKEVDWFLLWVSGEPYTPTPPSGVSYGTFTDARDSKTYKSVDIGKQTWMAQNLNYQPSTGNSWCYDNNTSNCNSRYGRLYDWKTAMAGSNASSNRVQGVCPNGWHLPSGQEWDTLVAKVGGDSVAGIKLRGTYGWRLPHDEVYFNGTNDYGFSALPGGYRYNNGDSFFEAGEIGVWWTATENDYDSSAANVRKIDMDNTYVSKCLLWDYYGDECGAEKYSGFSVRCVKN